MCFPCVVRMKVMAGNSVHSLIGCDKLDLWHLDIYRAVYLEGGQQITKPLRGHSITVSSERKVLNCRSFPWSFSLGPGIERHKGSRSEFFKLKPVATCGHIRVRTLNHKICSLFPDFGSFATKGLCFLLKNLAPEARPSATVGHVQVGPAVSNHGSFEIGSSQVVWGCFKWNIHAI